MKIKQEDITILSDQELKEKIEAEKSKLIKLKLQHAVSPLPNPMEIRHTRKNIARLLTELSKRKNKQTLK